MKQVQSIMSRWIKGFVTTASMLVFSVSLASGNDVTTAPNGSTPYTYADPNSTAPSYNNVGRPVDEEAGSLMLNNEALGLSGPINVSAGYSESFGYQVEASFSHMLGFRDAISLLGAYAPQENRIDITWAHAWTDNQRTKLSVERLSEEIDFDYDTGTVSEWVPQYAYGAGYQYLFNKNWLKSAELSGYYSQAQSQDLSTVRFTDETGTYDNYRHIAGATSEGSEATLNIAPWKTGLVGLGLNYDSVNYDTKYEDTDAEDSKGFGFTLSLEQLLSKHVKLNLEGSQREVYDSYTAGISFLTPVDLEVGLTGERTLGENGSSSDTSVSMNFAYFLDDHSRYQHGYSLDDASQNDLAAWASKSLAYMDIVLAAADQKTVRVLESSPVPANDSTSQSIDAAPVITLTAGEINRVNITAYIQSSNLTDAQKQAAPTITGGPTDVKFVYENSTESLVTTTEVPESAIAQEATPLVLVFPTDANTTNDTVVTKGGLRDTAIDKLIFKVTVSGGVAPTLNPAFVSTQKAVLTHAHTWVFNYENISQPGGPADSLTMFLNTNTTQSYLTMTNGYPKKVSDPNNCYTTSYNNDKAVQTVTFVGKASSVCPGNATYQVVTNNGALNSPAQTITFTAEPETNPYISGGPITAPAIQAGQAYSPGHTFTTDEVSPGQGAKFNTATSSTYLKVYDTKGGCVDVTSASNLGLGFTNGDTQTILQSTGAIPESLSGHPLKIYLHVTNDAGATADNGTTSNCGGSPFTATVEGAPIIPDNLNLGATAIDTSYSYDFMSQGGVTTGSSSLNTGASSYSFTINGAPVSSADLGLAVNIAPTDVTLSGIVNPGYAGDTVKVILNLTNTQGYSATNTSAPATLTVNANSSYAPSVAGGQTLTAGNQYATYTYTFPNTGAQAVTAGTNEKFNTDPAATYATVTNSVTKEDLSSKFALTFNSDETQVTLTSGSNTLATQDTINVVLHVENVDGQKADNAANPDHFDVNPSIDPIYQPHVAGNLALTNGVQYTDYTTYTFSTTDVNAGAAGSGESFDSDATTVTVIDPNGVDQSNAFALSYNADKTQITLNGVSGKALQTQGQWKVVLHVTNTDGGTADNVANPDTFSVTENVDPTYQPTVTGGLALTNGAQYTDYTTYTFSTTDVNAGAAGSGESFDSDATTVTVTDPNGVDQSNAFALSYNADKTQITLNGVSGKALQTQGQWKVVLHVTNKDGGTADNVANPDTFDVTSNPATMPTVNNVGNALTATVDGSTYNYTYTTTPMTAGAGATFNTTDTKATVIDTGNGNLDVSSQFTLMFNGDSATSTAITGLTASSATVSTLKGPLNVTYTAVNNYEQSITSTDPDTIGTDKISVTDPATLTPATVGTAYNYSFKQSANLTTGSTELSDASTVTFSDPNAGLSYVLVDTNADGVKDDVQITGTPVAGHSGTINLTLNLNTPDGLLPKTTTASVVVNGTTPVVITGPLPAISIDKTFSYKFANSGTTGPVVSAGASEYFDESATTFTVTGSSGSDETSLFHLVYSNDGVSSSGTGDTNNVITLESNGALTSADTLTVSFHVVNVDAETKSGSAGEITVGSLPGYLYCPSSAQAKSRPATVSSTVYSAADRTGDVLGSVVFNKYSGYDSGNIQLFNASISNGALTCSYGSVGDDTSLYKFNTVATLPSNAKGYGAGWSGSSCAVKSTENSTTADNSCQVTYTFTG
jgi:hypothetical protein